MQQREEQLAESVDDEEEQLMEEKEHLKEHHGEKIGQHEKHITAQDCTI